MITNSSDQAVATQLGTLAEETSGTLLALKVHKVGEEHGSGSAKKVYGDDQVHVLVWTGFNYRALIERSQNKLRSLLDKGGLFTRLAQETWIEHPGTTVEDSCDAVQELQDWFYRVMAGTATNGESLTLPPVDAVWRPLRLNNMPVRGARVYTGPERPNDPRAPKPGTIYLQGVKLGERVMIPAPNGHWKPDSKPKTIAKRILRDQLPIGLFVQYKLDPARLLGEIRVAGDASVAAREDQIPIDPEALRSLFKIAP